MLYWLYNLQNGGTERNRDRCSFRSLLQTV